MFHFNPLPPHGGRLRAPYHHQLSVLFQSTPSAWRETLRTAPKSWRNTIFQSTPSAWRETYTNAGTSTRQCISIHSLRMEGDYRWTCIRHSYFHFNPLPPHGGRRYTCIPYLQDFHFNPLPPHGGRQIRNGIWCGFIVISIHSLRMEGDPDLPCHRSLHPTQISIHSLRMEGDGRLIAVIVDMLISIHSLRMEGDDRIRATLFLFW